MIKDEAPEFADFAYNAASEFAQTMIFVDDEATYQVQVVQPGPVDRPGRRPVAKEVNADTEAEHSEGKEPHFNSLDAKLLIDNAMDLGLICSVLRPEKKEDIKKRVVAAARVADIVCLDWEIYDDGGLKASEIISKIIEDDAKQNGRVRLIAIYTVNSANSDIVKKVFNAIPKSLVKMQNFNKQQFEIESDAGTRIVCLFKTHGRKLLPESHNAYQVDESDLPKRLQIEFGKLSEGLLSNVALATIASIRRSTHHVLSMFTNQMDGPYFQHRASIDNPEDAEEYAVEIVLSQIKGTINKKLISDRFAGPKAIEARIEEIGKHSDIREIHYEVNGNLTSHKLHPKSSVAITIEGLTPKQLEKLPSKANFNRSVLENYYSSLFADDWEMARLSMLNFAALTQIQAYPGSYLYKSEGLYPQLGLGTIIEDMQDTEEKKYLLCLQASCDAVRIKNSKNFLFVELVEERNNPKHVVTVSQGSEKVDYVGLVTKDSYRAVRSIEFKACTQTKTVNAVQIKNNSEFYFEDVAQNKFRWIADMKRRRALRIAQNLGQNMARLGFEEFEPYRKGKGE